MIFTGGVHTLVGGAAATRRTGGAPGGPETKPVCDGMRTGGGAIRDAKGSLSLDWIGAEPYVRTGGAIKAARGSSAEDSEGGEVGREIGGPMGGGASLGFGGAGLLGS